MLVTIGVGMVAFGVGFFFAKVHSALTTQFGKVYLSDNGESIRMKQIIDYENIPPKVKWLTFRIERVDNSYFNDRNINEILK